MYFSSPNIELLDKIQFFLFFRVHYTFNTRQKFVLTFNIFSFGILAVVEEHASNLGSDGESEEASPSLCSGDDATSADSSSIHVKMRHKAPGRRWSEVEETFEIQKKKIRRNSKPKQFFRSFFALAVALKFINK